MGKWSQLEVYVPCNVTEEPCINLEFRLKSLLNRASGHLTIHNYCVDYRKLSVAIKRTEMAPKYKLTYFNIRGLGEPIRFILHYGGLEFEDNRLEKEQWADLKPKMPFGKLPILEVDGKQMHQSRAILRYLGKLQGLVGSSDQEQYEIDAIGDTIFDFDLLLVDYYHGNEEYRKRIYDSIIKETIPFYMSKLDETVKNNNGYFVGGKLSWVDIYFGAIVETMEAIIKQDMLTNYLNLKALKQKVHHLKGIKEWIAKRPLTEI